jgi:heterodisulfide reductase subunit C
VGESRDKAFEQAAELLRSRNLDDVCARCGAERTAEGLAVEYLNKKYRISFPAVEFLPPSPSYVSQLIILHYLASTGKEKTTGEFVGYRDLPGGMFYYTAYCKQGPDRIMREFGNEPEQVFPAAETLGGVKASFGDASVRIRVFPRVELLIVLYKSDDEFPNEAHVLYKNDIINFLSLKDISMLTGEIAGRFSKMKKQKTDEINLTNTDSQFKYEIASRPGAEFFRRCFSCGSCTASCPVSEIDENFNPRLIIRQCLLGMREEVLSSRELWFCVQCYTCYARCPQDVRFTDVMAVLREMAVEEGYAPAEMLKKAEKIEEISQKLRHELTEYAWHCMKGDGNSGYPEKLKNRLEQGIQELG